MVFANPQTQRDVVIFAGSVLIFLGLQHYLQTYITQYPWLAILAGIGLFIYGRRQS